MVNCRSLPEERAGDKQKERLTQNSSPTKTPQHLMGQETVRGIAGYTGTDDTIFRGIPVRGVRYGRILRGISMNRGQAIMIPRVSS